MKGTSKTVWVVVAYRWGERENHSYTLGVFTKKAQAIKCAESHTEYRGGKYGCAVEQCVLDAYKEDANDYTTEIFKSKSRM